MEMLNIEKTFVSSLLRDYHVREVAAPLVLSNTSIDKKGRCLEFGCGSGRGALLIKKHIDCERIISIDIDPEMIRRANNLLKTKPRWAENIETANIEYQWGDVTNLDFADDYFDGVFQFAVLHHVFEWERAINEVYRVLRKGGVFSFEEVILGSILSRFQRALVPVYKSFRSVPIRKEELISVIEKAGFSIESYTKKATLNSLSMCYIRAIK